MKVCISSVTTSMESYRGAAARGIRALGHEALRAEHYGASYESPQRKCLAAVRDSDAVVLLMGECYGEPQESGMFPTHEVYEEAIQQKPVLAFVQRNILPEGRQREFIEEVRGLELWCLHRRILNQGRASRVGHPQAAQASSISCYWDGGLRGDVLQREALLPPARSFYASYGPTLRIIVAGGPAQTLLGDAELEDPTLERELKREALLGDVPVFDDACASAREYKN